MRAPLPTLLLAFLHLSGPKHSTRVPFSVKFPVPLSIDENGPFVPNPILGLAVKASSGPHLVKLSFDMWYKIHSLLSFTLQMVIPLMLPLTVHSKVKPFSGHVAGAVVNFLPVSPSEKLINTSVLINLHFQAHLHAHSVLCIENELTWRVITVNTGMRGQEIVYSFSVCL